MQLPVESLVLFCDESLLVINKPAGISTLPDGYNPSLPHIKSLLGGQYGKLWIVHRLDKDTSGVLLLARSAKAHRSLNVQFDHRSVSKTYHAVISGVPEWQEKTVDLPLISNGDRQHRTLGDPLAGKPAVTHFKVLERFENDCLLAASPETGRTHQIRAHLSALGFCVLGDKLYCRKRFPRSGAGETTFSDSQSALSELFEGMALHSISLEIDHPLTGERMSFAAPYPPGIIALLTYLRKADQV